MCAIAGAARNSTLADAASLCVCCCCCCWCRGVFFYLAYAIFIRPTALPPSRWVVVVERWTPERRVFLLAVVGGGVIGRRRHSSVRCWCTHGAVCIIRSSRASLAGGLRRLKCRFSSAGFERCFVFIPFSTTTFSSVDAAFRSCVIDQRRSRSFKIGSGGGGGGLRTIVLYAERVDDTPPPTSTSTYTRSHFTARLRYALLVIHDV